MKNKAFDCVEMKHRGAEKIQKDLKGKSEPEILEYWSSKMRDLQKLKTKGSSD